MANIPLKLRRTFDQFMPGIAAKKAPERVTAGDLYRGSPTIIRSPAIDGSEIIKSAKRYLAEYYADRRD